MKLANKILEAINEAEAEAGFDLTSITANNFKKVLKKFGVSNKPKRDSKGLAWVWKGDDLTIYTGNDPISGKYGVKGRRDDEKDYASFIGLTGDKEEVSDAFKMIKKLADNIKGENATEREFI